MDASQYLRKQGWRGQGHSLDHTGRGIKKPLLISKKVDALGVGLNKHAAVSDQWWLRAFDNGLKTFGTGSDSKLAQVQKYGHKRSGLYDRFVRGAPIPGSIGQSRLSPGGETASTNQSNGVDAEVKHSDHMSSDISPKPLHTQSPQEEDGTYKMERSRSAIEEPAARDDRKRKRKGGSEGKKSRQRLEAASLDQGAQPRAGMGRSRLPETKAEKYATRAAELDLSVEEYAIRRQKKREDKAFEIARKSAQIQPRGDMATSSQMAGDGVVTSTSHIQEMASMSEDVNPVLAAEISSAQPESLKIQIARDNSFESKDYPGATEFADEAIRAISNSRTITITTDDGREPFVWQANDPIPLDTRIWEGAKVNTLPKVIRRARQAWMKTRREARKADKGRGIPRKQPRADRKNKEQEALAIDILKQSRHSKASGHATEAGVMSVKGFGQVPVVSVAGTSGSFSNEEMARARAVARRLIRHTKKEAKRKAKKDKGQDSVQGSRAAKPSKRTSLPRASKSKYNKRA